MPEPLLFLDVDGCVLVKSDPGGYHQCEYKGESYWYHPDMPKWLQSLDIQYDIRWASHHWRGQMTVDLARMFEIDTKPTDLEFHAPAPTDHIMRPEKLEAIKLAAGDTPSAVVDDKMGGDIVEWAKTKTVILIQPDESIGITADMYAVLKSFGEVHAMKSDLVHDFVKSAQSELVFSNGEWF